LQPLLTCYELGSQVEFDIWMPSHNIAIEYQGIQHYMQHSLIHGEEGLANQFQIDSSKEIICKMMNIELIKLPFWWKCNVDTVNALLFDIGIVDT
jgi:hypothetical protein